MHTQNKKHLLTVICLSMTVTILFALCGCIHLKPVYADGWLKRQVFVNVIDTNTSLVITGADVKIIAPDYMQRFLSSDRHEKKYEQVTDTEGLAELLIWFPFGSKKTLLSRKGSFHLDGAGTVVVNAPGYETFESEFTLLTGEHRRSVNDKSPIKIHIKLLPSD